MSKVDFLSDVRKRLDKYNRTAPKWKRDQEPDLFKEITVIKEGDDRERISSTNCVSFVFEFLFWVNPSRIVDKLKEEVEKPNNGDLVAYFLDGELRHIGIYVGKGRVISKWGAGPVFEHPLYMVPESYGNCIRYFKKPKLTEKDVY
jgi:hypothetical protein